MKYKIAQQKNEGVPSFQSVDLSSTFFSFSLFFIKKSRERKESSKEKKEREKILINSIY